MQNLAQTEFMSVVGVMYWSDFLHMGGKPLFDLTIVMTLNVFPKLSQIKFAKIFY